VINNRLYISISLIKPFPSSKAAERSLSRKNQGVVRQNEGKRRVTHTLIQTKRQRPVD